MMFKNVVSSLLLGGLLFSANALFAQTAPVEANADTTIRPLNTWPTTYPKQDFKIVDVRGNANPHHPLSNMNDGDWRSFWSTQVGAGATGFPHYVTLDLGEERDIHGLLYMPPPYQSEGRISQYAIYVSNDSTKWEEPVARGSFRKYVSTFWPDVQEQFETVLLPKETRGRYIRFQANSEISGGKTTAIAELVVITDLNNYPYKNTTLAHLKGERMAPSIHMAYQVPPARLLYVEMTIEKSAPGSYFMTAGFSGGYFGIQEKSDGSKVILFSLWDSAHTDNPFMVHADDQVKILYEAPEMLVRRFGGEGVGVQSFYNYDWKIGHNYKFVVKVDHEYLPGWTVFTSYFFIPEKNEWKKLMSLATKSPNIPLTGAHSFLEDFKRDFNSFKNPRQASVPSVWVRELKTDKWIPCKNFRFTADGNPNRNINAGTRERGGYAVTGGDITNDEGKLWSTIPMGQKDNVTPPELPAEVDAKALPDNVNDEDKQDHDDE